MRRELKLEKEIDSFCEICERHVNCVIIDSLNGTIRICKDCTKFIFEMFSKK